MFGRKQCKVEVRIERDPEMVAEFDTGVMLLKETAVRKEALVEECVAGYLFRTEFRKNFVFLRAGSSPAWDYVKKSLNGSTQFFKRAADIEVDREGTPIPMPTAGVAPAPKEAVRKGDLVVGVVLPTRPVVKRRLAAMGKKRK